MYMLQEQWKIIQMGFSKSQGSLRLSQQRIVCFCTFLLTSQHNWSYGSLYNHRYHLLTNITRLGLIHFQFNSIQIFKDILLGDGFDIQPKTSALAQNRCLPSVLFAIKCNLSSNSIQNEMTGGHHLDSHCALLREITVG